MPLLTLTLFLASCGGNGKNQIVKNIVLESSERDGDIWVSLKAMFMVGNLSMTSITLPIFNPKDPSAAAYGQIGFRPTLTPGFNEVELAINLTRVAKVNGGASATLPNGSPLPIGGTGSVPIIELAISQINSKVYFAFDKQTVLLGFAAAIKEFDALSGYIGGADIFLGFNLQGVLGSAGIFTSKTSGKSGLGMFVDLSSVINSEILDNLILNGGKNQMLASELQSSPSSYKSLAQGQLSFKNSKVSNSKKSAVARGISAIGRKKKYLNLVD